MFPDILYLHEYLFSVNVMYMNISLFVIKHTNCQMCFQFKLYHSKWSSDAIFEHQNIRDGSRTMHS